MSKKIVVMVLIFSLVLMVGFIEFFSSTYEVKHFLNENFNAQFRLDIYPEFFGGNIESFESAQQFNNGEISYQQYAVQKGYSIKIVPIEWEDVPTSTGGGGQGGPSKVVKGSMDSGAGGHAYMPEHCTMEWYSVDENGNMVSGPGGCF